MPKSKQVNQGWSKTKQVARKAKPLTPAQKRKCQLAEERALKAAELFVARELKKAAKLSGQPTLGMEDAP